MNLVLLMTQLVLAFDIVTVRILHVLILISIRYHDNSDKYFISQHLQKCRTLFILCPITYHDVWKGNLFQSICSRPSTYPVQMFYIFMQISGICLKKNYVGMLRSLKAKSIGCS